MNASQKENPSTASRLAALALAMTSVLVLFALMHHPSIASTTGQQDTLQQIVALQGKDQLVHGTLIAMLAVLGWSFSVFGQRLGAQRPSVVAARNFYYLGCGALTIAMLFDGFILPHFATRFVGPAAGDVGAVFVVLGFLGSVVQIFSKLGFLAMSIAILCWAFVLVRSTCLPGWMRIGGALGAAMSLIPALALGLASVRLAPATLLVTFAMYIFWNVIAAAILIAPGVETKRYQLHH
jgi:hypothetical protein